MTLPAINITPRIDALIEKANREIQLHKSDDTYWGSELDIEASNAFFREIGGLLGKAVEEDDNWISYLIKATSIEAYEFSKSQLLALKTDNE